MSDAPSPTDLSGVRIAVTGAGGPAAVAFMQSVHRAGAEVWAVDIDPYAAGLYLVGADRRALVPRGDSAEFVDVVAERCGEWGIDVLVPTVDVELLPVARATTEFEARGTKVLGSSVETLERCLDKWTVLRSCAGVVEVPATAVLDDGFDDTTWSFPAIAKPRLGSGGRGVTLVETAGGTRSLPRDGSYIVQELLPGLEHSLDVLAYRDGHVAAVVPRSRLKVDSGIAVAGTVDPDEDLITYGRRVAQALGLTSVANVQVKQAANGAPRLLEVNPRFPGSMPLTIAAGADMPVLAVADVLGRDVPADVPIRALAMVRTWTETYFDPSELLDRSVVAR
ncbi:ATP-grasp domain-containing protein [Desertimonas flava]|uniref:ATP-grasp domain-containing protein n=1 Tax=Desertimonas flava TaxID=2064846 RepID=UPI001968ACC7|nr:ATP-grasp domain-containing protein [Desertimonas flava]